VNKNLIPSGTLMTAQMLIAAGTPTGNLSLPVSNVVYSDVDGNAIAPGTTTNGTISVLPPTPVVTSVSTATAMVGIAFSYQITATNSPTSFNATGLPAGLNINTVTGLISGTPTTVGISTVSLSAINAGGTGTKNLLLTVNPQPPLVTSAGTATGMVGTAFSYQITASNNPTSFNATGLPSGLNINTGTGLISGTAATVGLSTITLSATNVSGTGTKALILTINPQSPVITSAASATGLVGRSFTYQITATNNPTNYSATGLAAGLIISTGTGLISGTPTLAGNSNISLSATNSGGTGTGTLSLTLFTACDLNRDGLTDITDIQALVNQAIGVAACTGDINLDTLCNILDIQRVVNVVLGGQCVSP
jgi:hypothetical protein